MDTEPFATARSEIVFFHGHPSWRATLDFYIKGVGVAVVAGVIAGVVTDIFSSHVQIGWIIGAVAAVLVVVLLSGLLERRRTTYTITDQRLTIQKGLLAHELHETRLERVQNVNSSQSILERVLGVGTVDFDTAGSAEYDFAFRGVANPREIVRTVDRALHRMQRL
jgi:uncharacterized membrane protein YdbT with pleckstrin-like domain